MNQNINIPLCSQSCGTCVCPIISPNIAGLGGINMINGIIDVFEALTNDGSINIPIDIRKTTISCSGEIYIGYANAEYLQLLSSEGMLLLVPDINASGMYRALKNWTKWGMEFKEHSTSGKVVHIVDELESQLSRMVMEEEIVEIVEMTRDAMNHLSI